MQKRFTLFSSALAIACAVLSLTGCRKDLIEPNPVDSVGPIGGGNTVTLDLPVSETDGFVNVTTKSVISENSSSSSYEEGLQKLEALEGKYSDVTVFQFDSGNKLVATYYQIFPEGNGGGIYVKSISGIKDEEYTFWAVANAGDLSGFVSTGDDVSKMADLVLEMPSVETNLVQYWEKGFPKVAKTELTTIDSSNPKFKLKFDRLVARVLFSLTTNLKYGSFEVTSLAVRQCNSKVYPFGTSKAVKVEDVMTGEMTSQIDLEALNSNDGSMYAYFYVPENMQGVPASLEGNTNPKNKNAQTIGEPLASLSTYLELTGVYTEGSGQLQTENHYRAYLGQNATNNLDVQRNTSTRFALSLKDDSSVLKGDWSADRNYDPSMDQRELAISPNPIQVSNEVGGVFTVYSKGVRYNKYCKYSLSQNLVDAGVVIDGYVLRQTKELDSDVEGTLTATSWDGVKTATATVKALKYAPAVIITPTPSASSSSVETMQMQMTAPVQTKTLYPRVTLSDGTQATITALESPTTVALEEGNTSYSTPIVKGKGSLSNNFYYQIEVTAGKEGKATIHNTCKLTVSYTDTKWSAEDDEPIPVLKKMNITGVNDIDLTVEEDRTITFSNAKQSLYSGESGTAQVVTNFDGLLSFSSSAGSEGFVIRMDGLEDSVVSDVVFKAGVPRTIEYQYNGSDDMTIDLEAEFEYEYGEHLYDYLHGYQTLNLVNPQPIKIMMCWNGSRTPYYGTDFIPLYSKGYTFIIENPSDIEFILSGYRFRTIPSQYMVYKNRTSLSVSYDPPVSKFSYPGRLLNHNQVTVVDTYRFQYTPVSDPEGNDHDTSTYLAQTIGDKQYWDLSYQGCMENDFAHYLDYIMGMGDLYKHNLGYTQVSGDIIDVTFLNDYLNSNWERYIVFEEHLTNSIQDEDYFYGVEGNVGICYSGVHLGHNNEVSISQNVTATAKEKIENVVCDVNKFGLSQIHLPNNHASENNSSGGVRIHVNSISLTRQAEDNYPKLSMSLVGSSSIPATVGFKANWFNKVTPNGKNSDPVYYTGVNYNALSLNLNDSNAVGMVIENIIENYVRVNRHKSCWGLIPTSSNCWDQPANLLSSEGEPLELYIDASYSGMSFISPTPYVFKSTYYDPERNNVFDVNVKVYFGSEVHLDYGVLSYKYPSLFML